MWDLLTGDFKQETTSEECLQNASRVNQAGSILVMHDKARIKGKLHEILPLILENIHNQKWETGKISSTIEAG